MIYTLSEFESEPKSNIMLGKDGVWGLAKPIAPKPNMLTRLKATWIILKNDGIVICYSK